MSHDRPGGRRANARAFRPTLEGNRLESHKLLTTVAALSKAHYLLTHPSPNVAKKLGDPKATTPHTPILAPAPNYNHGVADIDTARGGQSAIVAMPDGSRFRVSLSLADNQFGTGLTSETGGTGASVVPSTTPVQPIGTVRVYPMPGDQVGIIVDGATQYQQLTIDPLPVTQRKGFAHTFGYGEAGRTEILNVGSIQVNGGALQGILGFHSANLSGPLTVNSTSTVDRIAFDNITPGGSIGVGGTLNTLDIANSAALTAGAGITINGDLNLLNVGGDLTIANGVNFQIKRFIGLTPQPPKGTGTGSNFLSLNASTLSTTSSTSVIAPSLSANISGNVTIGPGSVLAIASGIGASSTTSAGGISVSPFLINGQLQLASGNSLAILNQGSPGFLSNTLAPTLITVPITPPPTSPPFTTTEAISPSLVARNGTVIGGVTVFGPG